MKRNSVAGKYFYGNEISEYGQEHGFVDYRTLAKAFDAVMCNDIISKTQEIGYWEQENGSEEYYEDEDGNVYTYDEAQEKNRRVRRSTRSNRRRRRRTKRRLRRIARTDRRIARRTL